MRCLRARDCHCLPGAGRHGKRRTPQNIEPCLALPAPRCRRPATPMSFRSNSPEKRSQSARRNRKLLRWCKTQSGFSTMPHLPGVAMSLQAVTLGGLPQRCNRRPMVRCCCQMFLQCLEKIAGRTLRQSNFQWRRTQPQALPKGRSFNVLGIERAFQICK
jgi:hypothetical protein